jgi:hypothetical protein
LEGLSIKMTKADTDDPVLKHTCRSEGLGKGGAERVEGNRGPHEEGIIKAGG